MNNTIVKTGNDFKVMPLSFNTEVSMLHDFIKGRKITRYAIVGNTLFAKVEE